MSIHWLAMSLAQFQNVGNIFCMKKWVLATGEAQHDNGIIYRLPSVYDPKGCVILTVRCSKTKQKCPCLAASNRHLRTLGHSKLSSSHTMETSSFMRQPCYKACDLQQGRRRGTVEPLPDAVRSSKYISLPQTAGDAMQMILS